MKNIIRGININIDKVNYSPVATFKQEDSGVLSLELFKNGVPFDITGQTVKLGAYRPNGTVVEQIDGFNINNNTLTINFKNNIFAIAGIVELDIELIDTAGEMTTSSFYIKVNKKILGNNNINASNELDAIAHIVNEFNDGAMKALDEWNNLKKIAIDENNAVNLQNQVNEFNSQLDTKANQTDLEAQIKRIDNFISLEQGSTTGDAELIDGRINVEGYKYSNLGGHIRDIEKGLSISDKAITPEKLSEDIIKIEKSQNILNVKNWVNYNISSGGVPTPSDSNYAYKIKIKNGKRYGLFREQSNSQGFIKWNPRISITDINNNVLDYYIGTSNDITISNSSAYYMWIWNSAFSETEYTNYKCMILEDYQGNNINSFIEFSKKYYLNATPLNVDNNSIWKDKNIVFFGDSITAQGNHSDSGITDNTTGYGYYAQLDHKFNAIYRGVGGQAFKRNSNTFYCNSDGSYAGRYGSGGITSPPSGTTTHLGYFSSWDRITAMIPESLRKSIDMVIINGGHNDFASVEDVPTDGVIKMSEPSWENGSIKDSQWKSSSYYNGGDYDVDTFVGAIASCIMKMQIWCPNAIIVLATPFPRWELTTMQQMKNGELTFRQLCEIEIATANYMQVPIIDLNGNCGINVTNYENATQSDNVHPNETGRKLYGRALIGELYKIYPKQ